jgi:hypothetical protein
MVDQTYLIKLATKHLDIALWSFLERRNLSSALKLAGGAEQIFDKVLSTKEDCVRDITTEVLAVTNMMASACRRIVNVDDLEYAAILAIICACGKYKCLGLPPTARMLEFDNGVYENMVGCNLTDLYGDPYGHVASDLVGDPFPYGNNY